MEFSIRRDGRLQLNFVFAFSRATMVYNVHATFFTTSTRLELSLYISSSFCFWATIASTWRPIIKQKSHCLYFQTGTFGQKWNFGTFFLLRVSGWSAVCEGIFVMHGMPCHVMISADGLQNSIFLSGCSASKLHSGWFRKTWHQKSSGYVVSICIQGLLRSRLLTLAGPKRKLSVCEVRPVFFSFDWWLQGTVWWQPIHQQSDKNCCRWLSATGWQHEFWILHNLDYTTL